MTRYVGKFNLSPEHAQNSIKDQNEEQNSTENVTIISSVLFLI